MEKHEARTFQSQNAPIDDIRHKRYSLRPHEGNGSSPQLPHEVLTRRALILTERPFQPSPQRIAELQDHTTPTPYLVKCPLAALDITTLGLGSQLRQGIDWLAPPPRLVQDFMGFAQVLPKAPSDGMRHQCLHRSWYPGRVFQKGECQ